MIGMNTLAVTLPLGGVSTGDLSDTLSTLITPAGFTFSIWSVIYLSMIVISLLIALKKITLPKITLSRYVISCVCNGLWIVAWHYGNLHLAMLLML
jgi:benzodiazapine receptor